jgi:hypothetical protein
LDFIENSSYTPFADSHGVPLKDLQMDSLLMPLLLGLGGTVVVLFGGILVYLEGMIGPET